MAYGARLESVLGESPRGFESPILRQLVTTNLLRSKLLLLESKFLGLSLLESCFGKSI